VSFAQYSVNVSSIQDFQQCRFRWFCKWVLNRVPRNESPALAAGKLLHTIFEEHFTTGVPLHMAGLRQTEEYRQLVSITEDPREKISGEAAVKVLDDMLGAFPMWMDKYPFTRMLECEKSFTLQLPIAPDITWLGRPDYLGICHGRVWHRQNRGLAAGMNFGTYVALAKRHMHEHLYAEYARKEYPDLPTVVRTLT